MQQVKHRIVFGVSSLLFALTIGVAAPVFAHAESGSGSTGSDDSTTTTTTSGTTTTSSGTSGKAKTTASTTETENETESHSLAEQFKKMAMTQNDTNRKGKQKAADVRQKSCEARKANLTKRMANAVAQAEKHKATFDKIYDKTKTFHDTKKLNVANYDTLVASADKAKADADANIQALKSLDVTIDCTQSNVADSVAAFKTAVGSTRDSLKTYRKSIVAILTAMQGASTANTKTTDSSTTTGGTQ